MRVQWIAVPALALLVAAPLAAQDEPGLPRAGRIEIERQGMPQRYMSLLMTQRPRLGVTVNLRASDTDSIGALVQSVTPGGPAAKAGIRTGDIITKLDGTVLVSRANRADTGDGEQSPPGLRLVELAARLSPNDTVSVELRRGRDRKTVRLITEGDSGGEFSYVPGRMWKQDSGMTIFRSMPDMKMRMPLELEQQMGPAGQTRMRVFFDSPLGDLELAPLNEDLGSYFGTTDGVLVISVPKDSKLNLKSGDVMEIMTSPNQQPTKDWLDFAVTTRARSRIRSHLRTEQRQKSINLGRELLENEMRTAGISFPKFTKNDVEVKRVSEALEVLNLDELLLQVGYGKVDADQVIGLLKDGPHAGENGEAPPSMRQGKIEQFVRKVTGRDQGGIKVNGIDDVLVRYAKCCNPLPGDAIIGFITRGRGVTIHRRECMKAFDTTQVFNPYRAATL